MGVLKNEPLFKKKGRPKTYDFDAFLSNGMHVRIQCQTDVRIYHTVKSSFHRWRKKHQIEGRFVFDIYPNEIVIWRRNRISE